MKLLIIYGGVLSSRLCLIPPSSQVSDKCAALTAAGHPCSITAAVGSIYCHVHKNHKTTLDELKKEIQGCEYMATKTKHLTHAQRRAQPPRTISPADLAADPDNYITRFKGLYNEAVMLRCAGTSRRTHNRCLWPAAKGSRYCKYHGAAQAGGPRKPGKYQIALRGKFGVGRVGTRIRKQKAAEFRILARVIGEYGL